MTSLNKNIIGCVALVSLVFGMVSMGISREVAVGGVKGIVTMSESKQPLPKAYIILYPADSPEKAAQKLAKTSESIANGTDISEQPEIIRREVSVRSNEKGEFKMGNIPEGWYTVDSYGKAHRKTDKEIRIFIKEGEAIELNLPLKPLDPYLNVYASQRVFLPNEPVTFQAMGFIKSQNLKVKVNGVGAEQLASDPGIYQNLLAQSRFEDAGEFSILKTDMAIRGRDAEGVFETIYELPQKLPQGAYTLEVGSDDGKFVSRSLILVTDLACVFKSSDSRIDTFVTDLLTGAPISGAKIQIVSNGVKLAESTSDSAGFSNMPLQIAEGSQEMAILATVDDRLAIGTYSRYGSSGSGKIYIYSDRTIYRPGDRVEIKGIARTQLSDSYITPVNENVSVEVKNYDGEVLQKFLSKTTKFGTFTAGFDLPKDVAQNVWISAKVGGIEGSTNINVSSYRKPEFNISAKPTQETIVRGDRAEIKVKCEYFFGGPVVGTNLNAMIRIAPLWEYEDEMFDDTTDYSGEGEIIGEVNVTTNDKGEATISYPTNSIDWKKLGIGDSQIQVQITGQQGDNYFSADTQIKVRQGQISARIEANEYLVKPNELINFTLKSTNIANNSPATVKGKVEVYRVTWDRSYKETREFIESIPVQLNNGKGAATYTPNRGGSYTFDLVLQDSKNRSVKSSTFVYVQEQFWGGGSTSGEELSIQLNKRKYEVGDKIVANIRSAKKLGSAWVTLEDSDLRESKLVNLDKGSATVEFTALSSSTPNGFITVQSVYERKIYQREKSFAVSTNSHSLQIEVTPAKKIYLPGESVSWNIIAKDSKGSPIEAELSLAVVDEAVFKLLEDTGDPLDEFFPRRYSAVYTGYSFPEVYLDGGDKGEVTIEDGQIRKNFRDTASWVGTVITDSSGKATITTALPDNITTWRATAVAVGIADMFGKSKSSVIARKELMIQAFPPSHWTSGDVGMVKVAVTEGAGQSQEVRVQLDAPGMKLSSEKIQTIQLKANETREISWNVSADLVGVNELKVLAKSSLAQDGVILKVPTLAFGTELKDSESYRLDPTSAERKTPIFRGSNMLQSKLKVSIAPSLLTSLQGSIDALVDYPYGCVEQTMSRFAPALIVQKAMTANGIVLAPELSEKITEVTRQSLARLVPMQNGDGGFGWWESDESGSKMTALVLEGLADAKKSGVSVSDNMINSAIVWGETHLVSQPVVDRATYGDSLEDKAALAAAILAHRPSVPASKFISQLTEDSKSPDILIAIAKADTNIDRKLNARKLLLETVILSEANNKEYFSNYSRTRRLSQAILLMLDSPEPVATNEQITTAVTKLMKYRQGAYWVSTEDTAAVLKAVAQYSYVMNEKVEGTVISIQLGNEPAKEVILGTMPGQIYYLELEGANIPDGKNDITVKLVRGNSAYVNIDYVRTENNPIPAVAAKTENGSVKMTFHKMVSELNSDGSQTLVCEKSESKEFKSGDILRCRVVFDAKVYREFLMVNVPIPSGMRSVDDPLMGYWWYSGMQVFDDRVAAFVGSIWPKDSKETVVEFNLRAERPGTFNVSPAFVEPMYAPQARMYSGGTKVTITP